MRALIFWGGWLGHQPEQVAGIFKGQIEGLGGSAEVYDRLEVLTEKNLEEYDLIIPIWTMGSITNDQAFALMKAVYNGVGLAGCHGGMCDAFRNHAGYQFMTGGQFVGHPGGDGVEYTVHIKKGAHPLVEGLEDYVVQTEQYYMHVDPANTVLAVTRFPTVAGPHTANGAVEMPVAWIRRWGGGRVFYNSLGHQANVMAMPQTMEMMARGFRWAVEGKPLAAQTAHLRPEFTTNRLY